jgi:hypothetical protein
MLSNPAKATKSNIEGINYVVGRMAWYSALTEHLVGTHKTATAANVPFESVSKQLEHMVFVLYKAILLYQMKSVCSYYKHQGLVFLQTLFFPDKWVADLASVKAAENDLHTYWEGYDRAKANWVWDEGLELSKGMKTQLENIHQDLRKFIDLQQKIQWIPRTVNC